MNDGFAGFCCAVILALIAAGLGYATGNSAADKRWHTEIVSKGHASWIIAPDGSTTFQWKEVK